MSVGSLGSLGYSDDQPQVAYDAQQAAATFKGASTGQLRIPVIDCSAWASTYVAGIVATQLCLFQADWYMDSGQTLFMGTRSVMLDPNTPQYAQFTLSNLGPWVQYSLTPQSLVTQYTPTLVMFLTNRVHPTPAVVQTPDLLVAGPASIAAGATYTQYLNGLYAGNVAVATGGGQTAIDFHVQFMDTTYTYRDCNRFTLTTGAPNNFAAALPLAACRIQAINTSGTTANTQFTARIVPQATSG